MPASVSETQHDTTIAGKVFTFGYRHYKTANGDRERAYFKLNGKSVSEAKYNAERKAAKEAAAVAEVLTETGAAA